MEQWPALAQRYEVIIYGLVFSRIHYQTLNLECQVWARNEWSIG